MSARKRTPKRRRRAPKKKKKLGRPTKYDAKAHERLVHEMALLGATEHELAKAIGISPQTFTAWKHRYPTFLATLKEARSVADAVVVKSLFQRATGYEHADTHISNFQGQIIETPMIKHYPPDSTAMIFWLKNRNPEAWRDRVEVKGTQTLEAGDTLAAFIKDIRERQS